MSGPFRIGTRQTELLLPPEACRADFERTRAIACADGLDPALLGLAMKLLGGASFVHDKVPGLGNREIEQAGRAGIALTFALGQSNLMQWLSDVTGCGPLAGMHGTVVQAVAGADHQLSWHDDGMDPLRRLAITINLSEAPYEGGTFELREKATHAPLLTHRHTEPGSVLIFQVAADIQHRILPITAGGPRRVYTGWFMAPAEA